MSETSTVPNNGPDPAAVETWLRGYQDWLCARVEAADGEARFLRDRWSKPADAKLQGEGDTAVLAEGRVFERAGVARSLVRGPALPPSATKLRPELAGRPFTAMGVSVVFHPRNPQVPTTHCNVRLLSVGGEGAPAWWFGGGFDLTPYYGYAEDVRGWHAAAREAVGAALYPAFKRQCDEYFYLPHRQEPRGVGGIFYDDFTEGGFAAGFALMQRVGEAFWNAYAPIVERRKDQAYGERETTWQRLRRGRYAEFNLVWDRGTHFGLQSGGRTESILMSMPPRVEWRYDFQPEPGSPEATLMSDYLIAKDWL
jgi:coproporphyrinogen III oxidase